jgi:hypothetical protein
LWSSREDLLIKNNRKRTKKIWPLAKDFPLSLIFIALAAIELSYVGSDLKM